MTEIGYYCLSDLSRVLSPVKQNPGHIRLNEFHQGPLLKMLLVPTGVFCSFGSVSERTSKEKRHGARSEIYRFCLPPCLKCSVCLGDKNFSVASFSSWGIFMRSISTVSAGRGADCLPEPFPMCH